MRKISTTMATQHPDNAGKPYWHSRPFISTDAELKESYLCFSDLGIDEYNWDWEGKFVDEAVVDRLLTRYFKYFKKNPLGVSKFLTFRFPNPRVERQFRLARAFMVVVTSSQLVRSLGFSNHPIFEAILPLTETADEIIEIQDAFRDLVKTQHRLLKLNESISHIEIIPLFEQVGTIFHSDKIIRRYIKLHHDRFGKNPEYLRPYCARSDPALNSGLVPTILALKVALSKYQDIEKEYGLKLFPMLGTGSLPFRGGLSPDNIDRALDEYAGICTLTIQSAFRYDYPRAQVQRAIKKINALLGKTKAQKLSQKEMDLIEKTLPLFEQPYRQTVEKIAPVINFISERVERRRERMLHIGLFGYSRGVGEVFLPRAISYTSALYSLGVPPEVIGVGRGIISAKKNGYWQQIKHYYKNLRFDLQQACFFLNMDNLDKLAKKFSPWTDIKQDLSMIEKELKIDLGPQKKIHIEHKCLTAKIFNSLDKTKRLSRLITQAGVLRKSLG